MKRIALDTNIAVNFLNGDEGIISFIQQIKVIYLPITVCGELLYGAENSKKKQANLKKVKAFIKSCKILNTTTSIAETYAHIRLELKANGTPIPENDIWIAAICIDNNLPLASRDKHFSYIRNFQTHNPD